ncbi:hypothetical protein PF011_g21831 [Phytophthora fragariae]|uniref:Uncharacterized protein n=1 Tax=Phytophthora fragariae TaxID=53985 RepID=A0A6A3IN53_9STRA|nr:hypothetical protein PF011_g21831 [Phytophthora fragariae]
MLLKQRQVLDQHLTLRSVADLPSSDFSVACCKSDLYVSLKLNSTKPRRPCLKNTFNTAGSARALHLPRVGRHQRRAQRRAPVAKSVGKMDMSTLELGGHAMSGQL